MKNFKRILALVMVFCTVAAWMIPGVSAADNDLVVDFVTDFGKAGISTTSTSRVWLQTNATNRDKIAKAYPESNKWKFYQDSLYVGYTGGVTEGQYDLYYRYAGTYSYNPLEIVVSATGDFTLSLTASKFYNTTACGAYILEKPTEAYTNKNLPDHTSELAQAHVAFTTMKAGTVTSETTVYLEQGTPYILVLYGAGSADKTYTRLSGFSLNWSESVTEEPTTEATTEATTVPEETTTVPEESLPEIEHKTDNLTVNFLNDFTKAELAASTYHQAIGTAFDAAYTNHTIEWTTYLAKGYAGGGRFRYNSDKSSAALEVITNNGKGFIALKFRAPGTGWYKLAVDYTWLSAGDQDADLAGAYILPLPSEGYTAATLPDRTTVNNAAEITVLTQGTYEGKDFVELTTGKEYLIVFYAESDLKSFTDFEGFSLTYVGAEKPYTAEVDGVKYSDFAEALAALETANNKTVKLGKDTTIDELNLDDGVILDLNGKTLTVSGAVAATVTDSVDGTGRLAVAKESAVVTAPAGQVALWDKTTDASGYRVFNYTFSNYGEKIYEGTNEAATAVDENIHLYDIAEKYINNGGAKDDPISNVSSLMKTEYDGKKSNWCYEAASASNTPYLSNGSTFSSGFQCLSLKCAKDGWYAFRFRAPAEGGNMSLTLQTDRVGSRVAASFDAYVIKASDLGETPDYDAAIAANKALFTDCYCEQGDEFIAEPAPAFAKSYDFEANAEYVLILVPTSTTVSFLRLSDISFTRAAKEESMAQSIWSVLQFTNSNAYALIASGENDLSVGFDMAWNGVGKTFAFTDDQVLAWAEEELADNKTYGFYIRIEGFEKVGPGTLTGTPYISFGGNKITADTVTYNYTAE